MKHFDQMLHLLILLNDLIPIHREFVANREKNSLMLRKFMLLIRTNGVIEKKFKRLMNNDPFFI